VNGNGKARVDSNSNCVDEVVMETSGGELRNRDQGDGDRDGSKRHLSLSLSLSGPKLERGVRNRYQGDISLFMIRAIC